MKSLSVAPKSRGISPLSLPLAGLLLGCAMQQPTPETVQAVILSLGTSPLANKPTSDNLTNEPWRLGVLWIPGGMGGSTILSPGYGYVVRKYAISPAQGEALANAGYPVLSSLDYPSLFAPDAESVKVANVDKTRFCCPCHQAKSKPQLSKSTRHKRTVPHRPATPCRANTGGK